MGLAAGLTIDDRDRAEGLLATEQILGPAASMRGGSISWGGWLFLTVLAFDKVQPHS